VADSDVILLRAGTPAGAFSLPYSVVNSAPLSVRMLWLNICREAVAVLFASA